MPNYDSKAAFLSGEDIPEEFWDVFDEYDPAQEEMLQDQHGLDMRKARFDLNKQKRSMMSQAGKQGFAASGEADKQFGDLISIFRNESNLMTGQLDFDIESEKLSWLNAQYDIATSMADDIEQARNMAGKNAKDIAHDINDFDNFWRVERDMKFLWNSDNEDKRKFIKYAYQQGDDTMDSWKMSGSWGGGTLGHVLRNPQVALEEAWANKKTDADVTKLTAPTKG